ncbi:MAG: hypothetical protein R2824_24770 [Saprospiraceae bacterium]|nr:hypothetical protein [Lewinella sp.]
MDSNLGDEINDTDIILKTCNRTYKAKLWIYNKGTKQIRLDTAFIDSFISF